VLQLRPALAEWVLERTKLLKWLLTRIRVKASDSNKQYASEILSILVQVRSTACCRELAAESTPYLVAGPSSVI
jgi:hypothetical protein